VSDLNDLDSFQKLEALQQPTWPDQDHLGRVKQTLSAMPPLVFAGEVDYFKSKIAEARSGEEHFFVTGRRLR
jgi:3-deoxy-D-arabino-heptulosonate 7-phosphate (DAHP) synthase